MNNRNGLNNPEKLMWLFIGLLAGAMILFMNVESKDAYFAYICGGMIMFSALVSFLSVILTNFVIPHIARKKAAARALGKDGMKLMRHDEVAKLAYKGIYALLDGKLVKAEELLMQALSRADMRQNQMFCIEWLIRLYEAMENDGKMLWCYRKAVEYAPDNAEAQSRLGHAYFAEGKLDQAMYCFEQALRYDPNNGYSYFSIAKIQLIRGQDDLAFETLQKLVKINENHPLCHAELADYYAMQNNREMAEEEVKKAQLCGIKDPDDLNKRINAMLSFHETEFSGGDLPTMFYRRIETAEEKVDSVGRDAVGNSGDLK